MAVFQARAATSPSAVVMSWENLSRTSPVNTVSFPTAIASVRFRGAVRGAVQAVLGMRAQELFDRVDVPSDDDLHGVPGKARADAGLSPDAAPDVLPGGLAGPALQPLGVDEPARAPVPYHQKVQPQPSGGSNAARRSSSPASSHGHPSSASETPNGGALENILPVPSAAYLPQTSAAPSSTRASLLRCTTSPPRSSMPPTLQAALTFSPPVASPSRRRNVQTVLAARASAKLAAAYSAARRSCAAPLSTGAAGRSCRAPKSSARARSLSPWTASASRPRSPPSTLIRMARVPGSSPRLSAASVSKI